LQPILLDTCAVIWAVRAEPIARAAVSLLNEAKDSGRPVYVSPISAWEIGNLVSRGRLRLLATPERWFAQVVDAPNIRLAPMPPALLIASCFLPGNPPRDPADRILAATARDLGAMVMTRDRALLEYGVQGHIGAVAC
jgi:PIN domain nuclease of toxin-antitoxin system